MRPLTTRWFLQRTLGFTLIGFASLACLLFVASTAGAEDAVGPTLGVDNAFGAVTHVECCDDPGCDGCAPGSRSRFASSMNEVPIEKFRRSFFQGAELLGGYLGDLGDKAGGIDQTFHEARVSFGLPLGSLDNILGIRPYFRADHLRGPTAVDLPETLYNTGVTLLHQKKWTERHSTMVILSPAVRSDFTTSENATRLFGLAVVNWQARRDLQWSLGVVYFDRADFSLLPAIGFTWTPNPCWKIDATMPRPRIAHRLWKQGGEAEGWAFLGGKIGGTTWAVTRDAGIRDELTLRDLRLFGGYEVLRAGNRGFTLEAGYAFDRTIELEKVEADIELDSALFLEAAYRF